MGGKIRPDLAIWLMDRAQVEAKATMRAFGGLPHDPQSIYLHAGAAVEFALKAVLARVNVLLIADPRNFAAQWELATSDAPISEVATRLVTIPLTTAIERAQRALPELGSTQNLKELARRRNAAAHLGAASPKGTTETVLTMLTALRAAVAKFSGIGLADFLGRYGPAASEMLARKQTETEKLIAARLVSARERFDERFDRPVDFSIAEALHHAYWADPDFALHPCPACGTDAALGGIVEVREHVDYDREDDPSVHLEPIMWPSRFLCLACGLELTGRDELAAATIDADNGVQLEGDDAEDAIYAYQEDLYMELHDEDRHGL